MCLGERYGYDLNAHNGYNYITGGGGIIFKPSTVQKILESCYCPNINSPDDMIIGLCLRHLNIPVTHSPLFHQARPIDYAPETLLDQNVISFHKFWQIDPSAVYRQWFERDDQELTSVLCDGNIKSCEIANKKLNDEL